MNKDDKRLVRGFWENTEGMIYTHLDRLDVRETDADLIVQDLMKRCAGIPSILSECESEDFYRDFGALIIDLVTAEQRLIAARNGRMPGRLLGDWLPTPILFAHPFLAAIQGELNHLEVEANKAEGGKRLN